MKMRIWLACLALLFFLIRNISHKRFTIDSESFYVTDVRGDRYKIHEIIYSGHPAGEREIQKGAIILAGILFSTDLPTEDLILWFTPTPDSSPFRIRLRVDAEDMALPIDMQEIAHEIYKEGDLPADVSITSHFGDYSDLEVISSNFELAGESAVFWLHFANENNRGGNTVTVILWGYRSLDSVTSQYLLTEWGAGENGTRLENFSEQAYHTDRMIKFTNCHLFVSIDLGAFQKTITLDDAILYARKLDARLRRVACD